ncbi:hypothetical protein ACR9IA_20165, partial [Leclercia pneumoniae]
SRFRVKQLFCFSPGFFNRLSGRTLLTRRLACRCSVSVEAHYREFFGGDKQKIQKTFRSLTFHS